ncbi:MAG: hypothetical protein AB7O28_25400 [Vicinamibacterales bacterium]
MSAIVHRQWIATAACTLACSFAAATASAQQVHTFPGSSCQASGSAQDLFYSGTLAANRTAATSSAVCPMVRSRGTAPWLNVAVFVRDRHSTQDITCIAEARDLTGVAGIGWSQTLSTSGTGDQTLIFAPPGGPVPNYGPYVVVCSLPPMVNNLPSYIASYAVVEP